eukprot:CAMPEP_0181181486 /NCGR_PEP_ID=MMETSP1096-20121128/7364_1 /TAXON_ID=156174 ORGANISM="Chrysochromulina ericina, Strain CCMP281" /NCGR_SAMPLE_ID=MMETSP1096 /ASSEMBLY_ACC=CAM_ASM_000453 /LENGTH=139 /DNA_ID=CAMNT_0023269995 /DNA_START=240 /DNA_END=657 /DNA_ORIENTATION=-
MHEHDSLLLCVAASHQVRRASTVALGLDCRACCERTKREHHLRKRATCCSNSLPPRCSGRCLRATSLAGQARTHGAGSRLDRVGALAKRVEPGEPKAEPARRIEGPEFSHRLSLQRERGAYGWGGARLQSTVIATPAIS